MRIFFAGSERMQIPNVPIALGKMGHDVILYDKSMEYVEEHEEEYDSFRSFLEQSKADFVISTIFFQIVAAYTFELGIKYAVYGMDSPHYAAWVPHFPTLENVYLFCFDTKEILQFKNRGYRNVYYMPLAAGVTWADSVGMTKEEKEKYQCDISFVGGLYGDNAYDRYSPKLPQPLQRFLVNILEQSAFTWGGIDRMLPSLSPEIIRWCQKAAPEMWHGGFTMPDDYYFRQWILARKLSNLERQLLLELIAERYDFRLYTREEENVPANVTKFPPVNAMTDQLKVFSATKINLNITLRSIETGVPLRVFDIMSRAGFVLTDYRADALELFEEDRDIVMFRTPEEMIDKIDYYLAHDMQREQIGQNAYEKVKSCYSYEKQLEKIIKILFG